MTLKPLTFVAYPDNPGKWVGRFPEDGGMDLIREANLNKTQGQGTGEAAALQEQKSLGMMEDHAS